MAAVVRDSSESLTGARALKKDVLADVYRILCMHLGTPPTSVQGWKWCAGGDNGDQVHRLPASVSTPLDFMHEYVSKHEAYDKYVVCIQDPRHEYYKRYKVPYSVVVVGADGQDNDAVFLNIPAEEMKSMSVMMLRDSLPVWFACNVDVQLDNKRGLWDAHLYALEELYGIDREKYALTKAGRLETGMDMGTHVMLFTGVDLEKNVDISNDNTGDKKKHSGRAHRWRVENSWGTGRDTGIEGYYTMNDNWFNEYVFEIVAPSKYLSDKATAALSTEPVVLPPWDPMFSGRSRRRRRRSRQS